MTHNPASRDKTAAKEARRIAREAEHKRLLLGRARRAYSRARQDARVGKAADVERARLIYEAAKVLCRPAPKPATAKQPTKLEKAKAAVVAALRANGGRLDPASLRRLLGQSGALETEDGELTRQAAARSIRAVGELRRLGIVGQAGGRLLGYGMPIEAVWLTGA